MLHRLVLAALLAASAAESHAQTSQAEVDYLRGECTEAQFSDLNSKVVVTADIDNVERLRAQRDRCAAEEAVRRALVRQAVDDAEFWARQRAAYGLPPPGTGFHVIHRLDGRDVVSAYPDAHRSSHRVNR